MKTNLKIVIFAGLLFSFNIFALDRVWVTPDVSAKNIYNTLFSSLNSDNFKKKMIIRHSNQVNDIDVAKNTKQEPTVSITGKAIVLPVEFSFDSKNLTIDSKEFLKKVSQAYKGKSKELNNNNLELYVNGYTDSVGPSGYNQVISQLRAETVKKYLTEQGISSSIIHATGYGEVDLLDKTNPRNNKNRRVEIIAKIKHTSL
jgi:outer membrane protein OmpA-like peptidoglycan-associated protein